MISTLDNQDGFIFGYIEWYVTDKTGKNTENGEYIYVEELWIHPSKRKSKALNHLVYKIDKHPFTYKAKWVYWLNQKHKERLTRSYPRERMAKIGEKDGHKSKFSGPCASTSTNTLRDSIRNSPSTIKV